MLLQGLWSVEDDKTLLKAMWVSGAEFPHELAWEKLVPHRPVSRVSVTVSTFQENPAALFCEVF